MCYVSLIYHVNPCSRRKIWRRKTFFSACRYFALRMHIAIDIYFLLSVHSSGRTGAQNPIFGYLKSVEKGVPSIFWQNLAIFDEPSKFHSTYSTLKNKTREVRTKTMFNLPSTHFSIELRVPTTWVSGTGNPFRH